MIWAYRYADDSRERLNRARTSVGAIRFGAVDGLGEDMLKGLGAKRLGVGREEVRNDVKSIRVKV